MKFKSLLFLFLLVPLFLSAQVKVVKHTGFTAWYDASKGEPLYVEWKLTPDELSGQHFPRTNEFKADPLVPNTSFNKDYDKEGYDKGHQSPAEDNGYSEKTEAECFYFTNMVPQVPNLNRVTWKALEVWCRKEVTDKKVTLTIICGGYDYEKTIGVDKIAVPSYCWKAVEENGKWQAWLFPNVASVDSKPFIAYSISISDLDKKLGYKVEAIK